MQDWDTRIKNLKNDIQIARQKYVIPFTKSQAKAPETSINAKENQNNETNSIQESVSESQEKLYVNNDPASSLDLINSKEQNETVISQDTSKENTNGVAATEEAPTVDVNEVAATEEAPTVDVNEVAATEEAPTVDVNEVAATEEVPKVDMNELAAKEEEPVTEKTQIDNGEDQVKKTELELLEERGEDNLSDEEVDRMYELRLLRSQKKMNNELREQEQEVIKKADDEIAHLKTLLKPKPKKLPKGFVE
ncbi:hypothetical protein OAS37_00775 [Alphaproteobacteria bacterium]|nr:hypothetical protein [Alphaproteobacteria bacterium]